MASKERYSASYILKVSLHWDRKDFESRQD